MLLDTDVKRETLLPPQAGAFASANAVTSQPLDNYKVVRFLICTGTGEAANVDVTVESQLGADGAPSPIPFMYAERGGEPIVKSVSGMTVQIGGADSDVHLHIITVTADMLAGCRADRVKLSLTAAAGSTVPGAILAEYDRPRYTEN